MRHLIFTKVAGTGVAGKPSIYLLGNMPGGEGTTVYFARREAADALITGLRLDGVPARTAIDCDEAPEGWYVFASVPIAGFVPEEIGVDI